ncbi:hypothetical protein NDU88_000951 [Pleurodeles waltl]|uniref:Uncharacterized protein n=1 Tax=Pleurodeles waltl TaxID=8319 RepID=A0AAV7S7F7_PLEWA|nr:hypothetical protein NDU88_000951 [Pleurodeles waltl]
MGGGRAGGKKVLRVSCQQPMVSLLHTHSSSVPAALATAKVVPFCRFSHAPVPRRRVLEYAHVSHHKPHIDDEVGPLTCAAGIRACLPLLELSHEGLRCRKESKRCSLEPTASSPKAWRITTHWPTLEEVRCLLQERPHTVKALDPKPEIFLTKAKMYTYAGMDPIPLSGVIEVEVANRDTKTRATFQVTKDLELLAMDISLRVDWGLKYVLPPFMIIPMVTMHARHQQAKMIFSTSSAVSGAIKLTVTPRLLPHRPPGTWAAAWGSYVGLFLY